MLVRIASHAADSSTEIVLANAIALGLDARAMADGRGGVTVAIDGDMHDGALDIAGVVSVQRKHKPYMLATRETRNAPSVVNVGGVAIGGGAPVIMAGPCVIENERDTVEIARMVKEAGATILRGGAFKPRSSPYAFQGLGEEGLKHMARARELTGLPVVTEVMEPEQVELIAEYSDMLQVGARNMQNTPLLKKVGRSGKPVLLKRGLSATTEEWLMSAEYILASGNPDVVLCERGIRTFETATRFTLDLNAIPLAKELTHLPVIVDPSHGTGKRSLVERMSLASLAAGADGLIIEVHPNPDAAACDASQTITPETLARIVRKGMALADVLADEPVLAEITVLSAD
jgi:3-deoxy-7-phosphoheptulonate synthase